MSITLEQARAEVGERLADEDNEKWSETRVDRQLLRAFHKVMQTAANAGVNLFAQETEVSSSSTGEIDLSALKPLKILSLAIKVGERRHPIKEARARDVQLPLQRAYTLVVNYLPTPELPANPEDEFVYGSTALDLPVLEDLLILEACAGLLIDDVDDGLALRQLDTRRQELIQDLKSLTGNSGMYFMPGGLNHQRSYYSDNYKWSQKSAYVFQLHQGDRFTI